MEKKYITILIFIVLSIAILTFNVLFEPTNEIRYCRPVCERYESSRPDYGGMSACGAYGRVCTKLTIEECEDSVDILNYSSKLRTFHDPDGLPDCEWR